MNLTLSVALGVVTAALAVSAQGTARPDFSGTWQFDAAATAADAKAANMAAGPIFGDSFVAEQTPAALTLKIAAGTLRVTAVYALDGSVSTNLSPGEAPNAPDIVVTSRATWDDRRLIITSSSQSPGKTEPIFVDSIRTMWLDANGRLVIQRTGTPAGVVPSSRSVYSKQ